MATIKKKDGTIIKTSRNADGGYTYITTTPSGQSTTTSGIDYKSAKPVSSSVGNTPSPSSSSYSVEGTNVPLRNDSQASASGYYGTDSQNATLYRDAGILEKPMTMKESKGYAAQYGLSGIADKEFEGLTKTQAQIKAEQIKRDRQSQTSSLTSYTYNPQTISGANKTINDIKFKLDENNNYPWSNPQEKKAKANAILESYTGQIAKLFPNQDAFQAALNDPNYQNSFNQFKALGGDVNNIAAKITPTTSVVGETQNPDGTYTSKEAQTIDQYLGNLTSPSEKKAYESLIPEQKVYQDQISLEQSIPEQYKNLYFGTPDQVGLIEQKRQQAEEEMKYLDKKAKLDEKNARAQADYAIEKNNKETEIEEAKVEENRLASKNYLTGMLAKLGALNTSSSATIAIAQLDQKYQKQASQIRTENNLANRAIEIKLNETVDNIGLDRDQKILETRADLSKSEEDILKEVFKLQNDADRKTLSVIEKYTSEFRTQKDKYVNEAKKAAKDYANQFAGIISSYDINGLMEGDVILKKNKNKITASGVISPDGTTRSIDSILEASKGTDGYVDPTTYQDIFNKFVNAGGTRSEFLDKFPPNQYVNPKNEWLPSFLKFGSSSRTESKSSDRASEA